jgi:hypothetical protein
VSTTQPVGRATVGSKKVYCQNNMQISNLSIVERGCPAAHILDDLPGRGGRVAALDDRTADNEIVRPGGDRLRWRSGALVVVGRGAGEPHAGRRDQQALGARQPADLVGVVVRHVV